MDWTSPDQTVRLLTGHVLDRLRDLPDASVHCVVTSPPYWGLRRYGVDGEFGAEPLHDCLGWATRSPCGECFVCHLVAVMREVRRVLHPSGTVWLNLGDSYHNGDKGGYERTTTGKQKSNKGTVKGLTNNRLWMPGLKPKDQCMIPARTAMALQADGWWVRSDVIWCLSGATSVYARTQKGDMPISVRELWRLKNGSVKLWNGQKWTTLLGITRTKRVGHQLMINLRSGERISCTPTHVFPTTNGMKQASDILPGDVLIRTKLPERDDVSDCAIDTDAAWFAGLYLAEGSKSGYSIQITGHAKEEDRWSRVQRIAKKYGGSASRTIDGNTMSIRVWGIVLHSILHLLVSGKTAKDKALTTFVWDYSDEFLQSLLDGYLSGDGHWDAKNNRWRLGFTRNYSLERDLRTLCARLGYKLTLKQSTVKYKNARRQTFRGEIRMTRSGHANERDDAEVMYVSSGKCLDVYDIGVEDEPHLFALASGILTHNSKPNGMPGSQEDRPTINHEYVYLLAKSERYFYDHLAIREQSTNRASGNQGRFVASNNERSRTNNHMGSAFEYQPTGHRTARSVWTITPQPFRGAMCRACRTVYLDGTQRFSRQDGDKAKPICPTCGAWDQWLSHFAVMPERLAERCILAGTSERGVCPKCGEPWRRILDTVKPAEQIYGDRSRVCFPGRVGDGVQKRANERPAVKKPLGWQPACQCADGPFPDFMGDHRPTVGTCSPLEPVAATVLDPFAGTGTTLAVARRLGRHAVGIELNPDYAEICQARVLAPPRKPKTKPAIIPDVRQQTLF